MFTSVVVRFEPATFSHSYLVICRDAVTGAVIVQSVVTCGHSGCPLFTYADLAELLDGADASWPIVVEIRPIRRERQHVREKLASLEPA